MCVCLRLLETVSKIIYSMDGREAECEVIEAKLLHTVVEVVELFADETYSMGKCERDK